MTRVWARELGRKGVRVNCIAPGFIATDMTAKMPDEVLDGMKKQHAARPPRHAPKTWRAPTLFLASDDASFINGQVLGVDGGLVAGT